MLKGAAAFGAVGVGADWALRAGGPADAAGNLTLPLPAASGIEHVVVVMMENRSFDHFMGWLPGADGKQSGLVFTDRYGLKHTTHHLVQPASCAFNDPDHSYEGGRIELNHGLCDGWLKAGENDSLAVGYYDRSDLAFLGRAAPGWSANTIFPIFLYRSVGDQVPVDLPAVHSIPDGRGHRPATPGVLRRPALRGRGVGQFGRRSSQGRHPRR